MDARTHAHAHGRTCRAARRRTLLGRQRFIDRSVTPSCVPGVPARPHACMHACMDVRESTCTLWRMQLTVARHCSHGNSLAISCIRVFTHRTASHRTALHRTAPYRAHVHKQAGELGHGEAMTKAGLMEAYTRMHASTQARPPARTHARMHRLWGPGWAHASSALRASKRHAWTHALTHGMHGRTNGRTQARSRMHAPRMHSFARATLCGT